MYSKSFATFLIGVKQEVVYKIELVIGLLISFVWPLVLIVLWYAVFNATHSSTISGYTVESLASYYLISAGLLTLMTSDLFSSLSDSIGDGTVAQFLIKPMSVLWQVFLLGLPDVVVTGLLKALPMIIIAIIVFAIPVAPAMLLMFAAEVLIGFVILQLLQLMISMSAVTFTNVYGIYFLFGSISGLLGGSFIPLNMLPGWAAKLVGVLPFQFAYYVPLSVINGHFSTAQALSMMPLAAFWVALLGALALLQWQYTKRHIDAVGV